MKKPSGLAQKAPKLFSYSPAFGETRVNFNALLSSLVVASSVLVPLTLRTGSGVGVGVESKWAGE